MCLFFVFILGFPILSESLVEHDGIHVHVQRHVGLMGSGKKRQSRNVIWTRSQHRWKSPCHTCSSGGWGAIPWPAWCGALRVGSRFACLGFQVVGGVLPRAVLLDDLLTPYRDRFGS